LVIFSVSTSSFIYFLTAEIEFEFHLWPLGILGSAGKGKNVGRCRPGPMLKVPSRYLPGVT